VGNPGITNSIAFVKREAGPWFSGKCTNFVGKSLVVEVKLGANQSPANWRAVVVKLGTFGIIIHRVLVS
jgi:hypothetical protein